jgi:hypothetical protein
MSTRVLLLLLLCALSLGLGACSMKRTLTIDSRPSGAKIWVNGRLQQKSTPVDVPFTHYGTTSYRIEQEGYKSAAGDITIPAGLDGLPVVDLPLEMVSPDRRWRRVIDLEPLVKDPSEAYVRNILDEAAAMRARSEKAAAEAGTPGRSAPGRTRP